MSSRRQRTARLTRRRFLRAAARSAAAPWVVSAAALGGGHRAAPSERITLGMIGTGNQGFSHTRSLAAMPDAQVLAVCDPVREKRLRARQHVEQHSSAAASRGGAYKACKDYRDFRDLLARGDIDAVFIASPEHWHALQTVAAARAGKDVYCEKAMAATIAESQAMVRAVRRYGQVFQVGTQQRSGGAFRLACELARNGCLGKLHTIKVGDPKGYPGPPVRSEPVPDGTDYRLWLGPAPWAPYFPERLVNLKGWMLTYDYTVGFISGWGQHDIDIAQWGNGTDDTGPVTVEARATFPTAGLNDAAATWHAEYTYANGVRLIFASSNELPHGIRFEGDAGCVFVNRSGISAEPPELLRTRLPAGAVRLYRSHDHRRNFLDCVRSRRETICPVEVGHRTYVICNLCDIAARLGRKLRWDPHREQFPDDPEANRLKARAMRPPWSLC